MRRFPPAFAALLCLGVSFLAHAQYSIARIVYQGGAPYTDAELNSVAGLRPGQLLAHDSLAQAAQHLLDTGLFDDAEVALSGQDKARTVEFVLKPTPLAKLLPASFENFVWFTPAELDAGLRSRVPLYRGVASDAGNFADSIQAALQQMLVGKGVTAGLSHAVAEPTTQHPQRVVDFRIETPSVRVASLDVTVVGQSPEPTAAARATLPRDPGLAYNEGRTGYTITDFLLGPARRAGYIAAKIVSLQREFTDRAPMRGVSVTAQIDPGEPYKIASVNWAATPIYSAADFARDNALHPGDPAAANLLAQDEAKVTAAYRAQGYLDAYLDASPSLDSSAHTVAYSLHAIPGEPYHVHSVTEQGLAPDAQQDFDRGWRMKAGDVYNESYVANFLHNNTALQRLNGYSAGFQASADPQTHLVDLTITFVGATRAR